MVNVTERAKHQLTWLASTKLGRPDTAPRLVLAGAGVFGLIADGESDGDQRVEHEGRVILLIGRELGRPLAGSTLDWDETPHNARLVIKRPRTPTSQPPSANCPAPDSCACVASGRNHRRAA